MQSPEQSENAIRLKLEIEVAQGGEWNSSAPLFDGCSVRPRCSADRDVYFTLFVVYGKKDRVVVELLQPGAAPALPRPVGQQPGSDLRWERPLLWEEPGEGMATFILVAHRTQISPGELRTATPREAAPALAEPWTDTFTSPQLASVRKIPSAAFRGFTGPGDTGKADLSEWHLRMAATIFRQVDPRPLAVACHSRPYQRKQPTPKVRSILPQRRSEPWDFTVEEMRTLKTRVEVNLRIQLPNSGGRMVKQKVDFSIPTALDLDEARWYFARQRSDLEAGRRVRDRAAAVETMMKEGGAAMFNGLFHDRDLYSHWRQALRSGERIVWNIEGQPAFHRLPWEWLRDHESETDLALQWPLRRKITTNPPFEAIVPPQGELRILWVSARPSGDPIPRDSVLGEVRKAGGDKVAIHPVADGSYESMIRELRKHRISPRYHCLHLDMHGMVGTSEDARRRGLLNPGAARTEDRAGRGNLEEQKEETAFLFFEDEGRIDPVVASELAFEIQRARVPMVSLNVCESALVPSEAEDSSLAAHLVEAGVYSALGFQQPVSVVGAQRFFSGFYRTLAQGPATGGSLDHAVEAGREELRLRRDRGGGLELTDWSLPVWYMAREFDPSCPVSPQ